MDDGNDPLAHFVFDGGRTVDWADDLRERARRVIRGEEVVRPVIQDQQRDDGQNNDSAAKNANTDGQDTTTRSANENITEPATEVLRINNANGNQTTTSSTETQISHSSHDDAEGTSSLAGKVRKPEMTVKKPSSRSNVATPQTGNTTETTAPLQPIGPFNTHPVKNLAVKIDGRGFTALQPGLGNYVRVTIFFDLDENGWRPTDQFGCPGRWNHPNELILFRRTLQERGIEDRTEAPLTDYYENTESNVRVQKNDNEGYQNASTGGLQQQSNIDLQAIHSRILEDINRRRVRERSNFGGHSAGRNGFGPSRMDRPSSSRLPSNSRMEEESSFQRETCHSSWHIPNDGRSNQAEARNGFVCPPGTIVGPTPKSSKRLVPPFKYSDFNWEKEESRNNTNGNGQTSREAASSANDLKLPNGKRDHLEECIEDTQRRNNAHLNEAFNWSDSDDDDASVTLDMEGIRPWQGLSTEDSSRRHETDPRNRNYEWQQYQNQVNFDAPSTGRNFGDRRESRRHRPEQREAGVYTDLDHRVNSSSFGSSNVQRHPVNQSGRNRQALNSQSHRQRGFGRRQPILSHVPSWEEQMRRNFGPPLYDNSSNRTVNHERQGSSRQDGTWIGQDRQVEVASTASSRRDGDPVNPNRGEDPMWPPHWMDPERFWSHMRGIDTGDDCLFCYGPHRTHLCPVYTTDIERRALYERQGRCICCRGYHPGSRQCYQCYVDDHRERRHQCEGCPGIGKHDTVFCQDEW